MGLFTDAEQDQLIDLLVNLTGLSDAQTRSALIRKLPPQRKHTLDLAGRVRVFVANLVTELESARLDDGAWPLALVISEAIRLDEGSLLATQLGDLLAIAQARPPQPLPTLTLSQNLAAYDTCMVLNRRPFVDRGPLRRHLRDLVENGLPALIVNGQPGTGCSYTYELIKFLSELKKIPQPLYYVDVAWHPRNAQQPLAVVKELISQLGVDGSDLTQQYGLSSLDHWTGEVARVIFAHATRSPQRIWIILDNLAITQENDPAPEAGVALNKLAKVLVDRATKNPNLRLVLLGYPDAELGALKSEIHTQVEVDTVPAFLPADEITRFFTTHLQGSNRADLLAGIPALLQAIAQELQSQDLLAADQLWPAIHRRFPQYVA